MTEFMSCLAYIDHLPLVLASAVGIGVAIGGFATAIALGARS